MFQKYLSFYFMFLFFIIFIICLVIFPSILKNSDIIVSEPDNFIWPTPNYYTITSNFGYRKAPTGGASTHHSGIDIGAPEGSKILSICDGYVSFVGFKGAGGFTITIDSSSYTISYCHVNPNITVQISEFISKGEIISKVGPKYVENVPNNPYHDSTGKSTNGATTGPHLHLTIKKEGQLIDPLSIIKLINN